MCKRFNQCFPRFTFKAYCRYRCVELRVDSDINIRYYIDMNAENSSDETLSFSQLMSKIEGEFDVEIDSEKMSSILFTSGTTGKSKGVMLSQQSLMDNATCMDMDEPVGTVSLSVLPIHHAYCFTCDILACLCAGATICFSDSIMRLVKNLNIFNPDIILLVPMIIQTISYQLSELSAQHPEVPKAMLAKKTNEINADLPLYKRIVKTIVRS